jgi:hypothetical protein
MSLKKRNILPLWSTLVFIAACATVETPAKAINLNLETSTLEGWFSATGEWTLFSTSEFKGYNPYVEEDYRCVSLVNATGLPRIEYESLHRKKVVVTGTVHRYDALSDGRTPVDRLLSKRYYGDELVENSCLREYVFAVAEVRTAD